MAMNLRMNMDNHMSHVLFTLSIAFSSPSPPRDKKLFDMISLKQTAEDPHEIKQDFRQLAHASENTIALDEIDQINKESRKNTFPVFYFDCFRDEVDQIFSNTGMDEVKIWEKKLSYYDSEIFIVR